MDSNVRYPSRRAQSTAAVYFTGDNSISSNFVFVFDSRNNLRRSDKTTLEGFRFFFPIQWKCVRYRDNTKFSIIDTGDIGVHYRRNRKVVLLSNDKETGTLELEGKNDAWPRGFYDAMRHDAMRFEFRTCSSKSRDVFADVRKNVTLKSHFRCLREKFSWQTPAILTLLRILFCLKLCFVLFRLSRREQKFTTKTWETKTRTHAHAHKCASAYISTCNLSIIFILKIASLESNKDKFSRYRWYCSKYSFVYSLIQKIAKYTWYLNIKP